MEQCLNIKCKICWHPFVGTILFIHVYTRSIHCICVYVFRVLLCVLLCCVMMHNLVLLLKTVCYASHSMLVLFILDDHK